MRAWWLLFVGAVISGSIGCGGTSCQTPASPAAFELGTGDTCFERLTPGQTVPVNDGPQGGFHVWAAIGCADCGVKTVVEFGTKDPATKKWLRGFPSKVAVDLTGSDWKQRAGLTAFLPGDSIDAKDKPPKGSHVILSARVFDAKNTELHAAEVDVVLGADQESSCSNDDSTCGADGLPPCCSSANAG